MQVRYSISGSTAAGIATSIEDGVRAGSLPPGSALPPVRRLADDLGVSAGTVAAAYRGLRDRGVLVTDGRRGTTVRRRSSSTPRASRIAVPEGTLDLSAGNPDPDLLPDISDAVRLAAEQGARRPVLYGEPDVDPHLAEVARRLLGDGGVDAADVAVFSGALDAVERVLAGSLAAGDAVAVEDPGWGNLLDLVAALGLRAVPVAVDGHGPDPASLERALAGGCRAVVVTARAQNPTGAAVGPERAVELRALLADHPDVLLVEDDHADEVSGAILHTLSGATPRWAHVRSAAKAYGPDLRLAVLAGDAATVDAASGRQRLGPGWVSHLLQRTVAHLWEDAAVHDQVVVAARTYARRRAAAVRALADAGVDATGNSGFNVWVPVPDEVAATTGLLAAGWAVAPGSRFRIRSGPGLRVTVASLAPERAGELARAVAAAVRPTGRRGA